MFYVGYNTVKYWCPCCLVSYAMFNRSDHEIDYTYIYRTVQNVLLAMFYVGYILM